MMPPMAYDCPHVETLALRPCLFSKVPAAAQVPVSKAPAATQPKPEAKPQPAPKAQPDVSAATIAPRPQPISTDGPPTPPTWTQVVTQGPVTMRPRANTAPGSPTAITMAPRPCNGPCHGQVNGQVIQQVPTMGAQQRACSPPSACCHLAESVPHITFYSGQSW